MEKELDMSDTETTEPVEDNSAIKQMRKAIETKDAENAKLRGQVIEGHLGSIGLEAGRGLGKAIAAGFDGDLTPEAIAAYAKTEYDYEPVVENQQAQELQAAQQRVDGFGQASAPMQPANAEDIIRSHDQKLGGQDATRRDAMNALEAKVQHYGVFKEQT